MTETVDAVVLAGGKNSPEMEAATGVTNRALVSLGDQTMLSYVIDALRGAPEISRIFVVGDVPADGRYRQVPGGASLVDNLLAGVQATGNETQNVLVATSDIPFLTSEAVGDFVRRAAESSADLRLPYVSLAACQERFPRMRRTALKLREGTFTLGNMALVRPGALRAHRETIMAGYAARKSILRLGRMLGPGLLLRIILSQTLMPSVLTVSALEEGVTRLLGCRGQGILSSYPEVGADVDKLDDIAIARQILAP